MFKKTLLASSIILISSTAFAAGGYVGGAIGVTVPESESFDNATSLNFTAGYRVNNNFALEASYIDLGDLDDSDNDRFYTYTTSVEGLNFAAVGIFPVNNKFELYGKLGLYRWDISLKRDGRGEVASDNGTDTSFGFGATLHVVEHFDLYAQYLRFNFDGKDLMNHSIGALYRF